LNSYKYNEWDKDRFEPLAGHIHCHGYSKHESKRFYVRFSYPLTS